MINDAIKACKNILTSLEKMNVITSNRGSVAGALDDLSSFLSNEPFELDIRAEWFGEIPKGAIEEMQKVSSKLSTYGRDTDDEWFSYMLSITANFIRNDLEDCILGLQQAIQILEEEMNNEQQ